MVNENSPNKDGEEMQKIAVCGKGGSGKSVVTALLASGIRKRGRQVLVVDSDESNTGLHRMLGFNIAPDPLIDFMGGKKKVEEDILDEIRSGVPEGSVQVFNQELSVAEIPAQYIRQRDGINLVVIGKILMALEGCACPMGIVSRSFLKKVRLGTNELAIVDLEAGVEHFGRGVETSIDFVLVVVDPSLDSLEVAGRIHLLSSQLAIGDVWAVLNKIPSEKFAARLTTELNQRGVSVIGSIAHDPEIFESCLEGRPLSGGMIQKEIEKIIDFLFP
jgi:CO dehydrogenase maturation factor